MQTTEERKQWRNARLREASEERTRLEVLHGLCHHPKQEQLWNLAWEYGHGLGLSEVSGYYGEMAALLK